MTLLLDGGKLTTPGADGKERRLFSAAQSREMWTPQTPIRVNEPKPQLAATKAHFAASGLGFELRDYQGVKLALHGGWQFGFYSTVVLAPSAKLGIAILTNAESTPALNALKYRLPARHLHRPLERAQPQRRRLCDVLVETGRQRRAHEDGRDLA